MKISYNWLKDYVSIDVPAATLAERLSLTGFEVEEVLERRLDFPGVVVGEVLEVQKHPDADRLSVCKVDVGDEVLTIICGAPNVAADQKVPVAKIGSQLPVGMKIKKTRIRGVESQGMICSEKELGVSENDQEIWVLPESLPVGKPLARALNFQTDYVFDIAVTPNRPDALGHLGIAREVAAVFDLPFRKPVPQFPEISQPTSKLVSVEIMSPDSCPRYSARMLRNVQVGPSPSWLVTRLEAVGMRSINNVVDVTNYVMMETGQPLHAFDFDLLEGNKIIVRESETGERFTTLDGNEYVLPEGTVLICDAAKPIALGGIMGGLNSEVRQETRNILLESAYFNPEHIRRSARALGISTEASQRFERGTDPNGIIYAQDRATQLLLELTGGEAFSSPVDNYPKRIDPAMIPFDVAKINNLLGTTLTGEEMAAILKRIELEVQGGYVRVPTFRPDLERVADIAEEVARLYGFENIPAAEETKIYYDYRPNFLDNFVDELRNVLTGMGLQETLSNSMINAGAYQELTGEPVYRIMNPISADMSGLRNTLVLSLLEVIRYNTNRQRWDMKIFEINRIFIPPAGKNQLPQEYLRLGIALTGKREAELWNSQRQFVDFYDVKGVVEALSAKIPLDNFDFICYDNFAVNPGLACEARGKQFGYLGQVRREVLSRFDIEAPVFVAELDVAMLYDMRKKEKTYRPIPRYPWVDRDLAIVVAEDVPVGELAEAIRKEGGGLLREVSVFDVYRGRQVSEGKKSIAFRLIFQSPERTLTEAEINEKMDRILKVLGEKFNARLR